MQSLVCDLDMTLVDSRRDIAAALARALVGELEVRVEADRVVDLIGLPLAEMVSQLAPRATAEEITRATEAYKLDFFDRCAVATTVYPGVRETLAALRARGVHVAVATTKMTFMAQRVCHVLGLAELVDHIQGTDGFAAKPDPEVVQRALAALGVSPEAAVVVGDTAMDVIAARRAGARAVAVTYGIGLRPALVAAGADRLIDDFAELLTEF
jgi:phosphoglycolate phosphatase